MKDIFDLWTLAERYQFDGMVLRDAIRNTFERRSTELPRQLPIAMTPEFYHDEEKQQQWNAFLNRSSVRSAPGNLSDTLAAIQIFIMPAVLGDWSQDNPQWIPAEGWV